MDKIKVTVVDDSALMRKIISDMINSQEDLVVVDTARNGKELFSKISKAKPDVITLDVEMPIMDGIEVLKKMKEENIDIPVIALSSVSHEGAKRTIECLQNGAFDFISKPSGSISLDIEKVKDELINKIRLSYKQTNINKESNKKLYCNDICNDIIEDKNKLNYNKKNKKIEAVVIGASTGGPRALYEVVTKLPKNLGVPVFIVQHMPKGFTKAFAERLDANSNIKVKEASQNDIIEKNVVYIAQGGYHMEIGNDKKIHLNEEPSIWGVRPAVDKLFFSAANVYEPNILSVILTGMGRDGADGTKFIKDKGGITIAEDESTCVIYGMPKAAYETGKVDLVVPLDKVSREIIRIIENGGR